MTSLQMLNKPALDAERIKQWVEATIPPQGQGQTGTALSAPSATQSPANRRGTPRGRDDRRSKRVRQDSWDSDRDSRDRHDKRTRRDSDRDRDRHGKHAVHFLSSFVLFIQKITLPGDFSPVCEL